MTINTIPGRWAEGAGLVLGPALLLAGVLVRAGEVDFFPGQLAAYAADPGRMVTSYSLFAAGAVLLWPAVTALARLIGVAHPALARWGAVLTVLGLFGRVFHAGVSHLAFSSSSTTARRHMRQRSAPATLRPTSLRRWTRAPPPALVETHEPRGTSCDVTRPRRCLMCWLVPRAVELRDNP
ncbi:hypothetical protein [Nonomuraea sp. NPDC049684]|uniref:hypothetical protein n=1 Tax=Nonomuraea sp. NPDC049684 TaxID=3364356 RepID=UPI0037949A6B